MSDLDNAITKLENLITVIHSNSSEAWRVDMCDTILNPDAEIVSIKLELHVRNKKAGIDNTYPLQFPYTVNKVLSATEKTAAKLLVTEYRTTVLQRVTASIQKMKDQFTAISGEVLQDFERYMGDKNDKTA